MIPALIDLQRSLLLPPLLQLHFAEVVVVVVVVWGHYSTIESSALFLNRSRTIFRKTNVNTVTPRIWNSRLVFSAASPKEKQKNLTKH